MTEGLLLPMAAHVDVVEPVGKFSDALRGMPGVRTVFPVGLEDWRPPPGVAYDLVWAQWCLGYLDDAALVRFLAACATALTPGAGLVVVKENVTGGDADVFDATDSSVTRRDASLRAIFARAGLGVVRSELQRGYPETAAVKLFPVHMYALKPR